MAAEPGRDRPHHRSWKRFAGIVALFALMGPLIGAIIPVMLSLGELPELMQFGSPLKAFGLRLGIVGLPHFGGREPLSLDKDDYLWLVLGHLMPALACAWLARRLFVPVRSSGDR